MVGIKKWVKFKVLDFERKLILYLKNGVNVSSVRTADPLFFVLVLHLFFYPSINLKISCT